VPQIEITNTHPDFVWLVNTIETLLSCTVWHTQVSAEVGYRYRKIVDKYVDKTCENVDPRNVLGDFSMRGQQSAESAIKSSAGWLLSFNNTATVPAIMWLEKNYNCDVTKDVVGRGAISTEHSVMCSDFSVDGDEITQIKRLLTEIYPNHSFSMVSDSYDYWNLVTKLLPQCKEEVMAHEGYIGIRGDSGDPIEVIAGKEFYSISDKEFEWMMEDSKQWVEEYFDYPEYDFTVIIKHNEDYYKVYVECDWTNERGALTGNKYYYVDGYHVRIEEYTPVAEDMGTVWALWQTFGGVINSKGYKVLDPHVKAIYGDSITPYRCEEIYKRLEQKGFAINNVTLGVGSFSMMCLEEFDVEKEEFNFKPYTRDTFGIAVKATYAEDKDGNPIMIYKQPKGCDWKKSQKGCCIVTHDENGNYTYTDGYTWDEAYGFGDLKTIFYDGHFHLRKEETLEDIRKRMYGEGVE
jgi:nicotinamide phosphoribosyltransferase